MSSPRKLKAAPTVKIADFEIGGGSPFSILAGPCQIEGLDHALMIADSIARACRAQDRNFIYKSSFDKANRSSLSTARGVGMEEA